MQETKAIQKQLSPYNNKNLFSRHYLKNRLKRSTLWEVDEDELQAAFDELKRIYEREKGNLPSRTSDEEGLRDEFISPILTDVLGFEKEKEKTGRASARAPDYALYNTREKKNQAVQSGDYYTHAIGLVEAKPWKANLERKNASGGQATENNPTKQIIDYLIENDPQWGMLTNGKKWRLVHREASNRLDTYYEVDIEAIIAEDDLETFKYFYLFFRRKAFEGTEGDKLLDDVREESIQYATEIGEDLEENIYQALEWIAKGFMEIKANKKKGIEDEPIEKIHDHALILLYRLLFALYADARGILGDPSKPYEDYDFSAFVDDICEKRDEGHDFSSATGLWMDLNFKIFKLIDEGSEAQGIPEEEFHIPAYNGGLFDQEEHDFFKKYTLRDRYLAKVIDLVARTNKGDEDGRARVDYFDLSVRHLGGIYEGLLEYQLEKADEDMVEVKEDGDQVVKTVEEAEEDGDSFSDDDIIEEGQPYLVTDDGERKATGSYYTPDYIVKYIVENTVGPKVEEKVEGLETDEEKAEAILDMQVLDPAMGSAHFLVEVIDYLATELVDYKEIEIDQAKREVARKCVYGVDINPLATELGKLSIWLKTISEDKPLSFLDHHIKTGNSLIGTDIHDINRHPDEDEDSERQVTIGEEFGEENAGVVRANVKEMLKKFKEIQEKQADRPEDIKEQEQLYEEFLNFPFRKRFDVLADVYTSYYFDNNYKVDDYNRLLQAFKLQEQKEEGDEEWSKVIREDWVQKATDSLDDKHEEDNISNQKGFFHWKLEFPEVFFDIEEGTEKENSGFDAVVGNPPYIRSNVLKEANEEDWKYLKSNYQMASYKEFDIYACFIEKGSDIIGNKGVLSYILPNKFLTTQFAEPMRDILAENNLPDEIIEFNAYQVFEDVTTYTCIFKISQDNENLKFWKYEGPVNREIKSVDLNKDYWGKGKLDISDLDTEPWLLVPEKKSKILDKISKHPKLESYGKISQGTGTRADDIFVVDSISEGEEIEIYSPEKGNKYTLERDLVKKCVKAKDLNNNIVENKQRRIIAPYREDKPTELIDPEVMKDEYPKTYSYLEDNRNELESREKGKYEGAKFYQYGRPQNMEKMDSEKLLLPAIVNEGTAVYDSGDYWVVDSAYFFLPDEDINLRYLSSFINSSMMTFFLKNTSTKMRGGYYSMKSAYSGPFPIPEPDQDVERLEKLDQEISRDKEAKRQINVDVKDYLTTPLDNLDGKTLGEMYMPVEGLSKSILTDTKEDRDNIKIGSIEFKENGSSLILRVSVKYKPEDNEGFDDEELDRWGYVETDLKAAMNFTVDDRMKALIKEFVPVAVDEAGGFANFREKATKTKSVVDRLEDLTLPKLDDVEQGLEKFIENKEKAEELEEEIQETDNLIDAIVFDLYELTEEEAKTVLNSLDADEEEKQGILQKFRDLQ